MLTPGSEQFLDGKCANFLKLWDLAMNYETNLTGFTTVLRKVIFRCTGAFKKTELSVIKTD